MNEKRETLVGPRLFLPFLNQDRNPGVYIMQNTMVVGGRGDGRWGKKSKMKSWGKLLKKGKKKGGKLHEKKGKRP